MQPPFVRFRRRSVFLLQPYHNNFNKRVVKIGDKLNEINPASGFTNYGVVKGNYLLLEGSIPGPKKRLIMMRHALRPPKTPLLISEIKEIKK